MVSIWVSIVSVVGKTIHNHGGQDHIHSDHRKHQHQHWRQHQQTSCHSDIHGSHMGIHSIHGGQDHIHNHGGHSLHGVHNHRHHSMQQHQLQQLELQQQQQKGR